MTQSITLKLVNILKHLLVILLKLLTLQFEEVTPY